jgi:hypothetical protein
MDISRPGVGELGAGRPMLGTEHPMSSSCLRSRTRELAPHRLRRGDAGGSPGVNEAVVWGAVALAVLNAVPCLLGGWRWYRGESSRGFWALLRVAQVGALVYALAVGALAAAGHSSTEELFYLYALLPLAVGFVAEQLRVASAQTILDQRDLEDARAVGELPEGEQQAIVMLIVRREMGVMTLSALVVVFLALRAAGTAHGF